MRGLTEDRIVKNPSSYRFLESPYEKKNTLYGHLRRSEFTVICLVGVTVVPPRRIYREYARSAEAE